jgi:hypothetical protein
LVTQDSFTQSNDMDDGFDAEGKPTKWNSKSFVSSWLLTFGFLF